MEVGASGMQSGFGVGFVATVALWHVQRGQGHARGRQRQSLLARAEAGRRRPALPPALTFRRLESAECWPDSLPFAGERGRWTRRDGGLPRGLR